MVFPRMVPSNEMGMNFDPNEMQSNEKQNILYFLDKSGLLLQSIVNSINNGNQIFRRDEFNPITALQNIDAQLNSLYKPDDPYSRQILSLKQPIMNCVSILRDNQDRNTAVNAITDLLFEISQLANDIENLNTAN